MGKFSRTWSIMHSSWEVLKQDKELLVFPLISGICCILVMASFAYPVVSSEALQGIDPEANQIPAKFYIILFLFYFCNYFIIVFFNAAIIACAEIRMSGGNPTVSDGFKAALERLPLIAGWALVSATVGLILRIIEDRSEKIGQIVAALLGLAWTVVSFLVIPVLVIEKKGPIESLRESTKLLRQTWGEQVISRFSFGLLFFVLSIPGFLVIFLGMMAGSSVTYIALITGALYLILLALIQSTLQAIFQTAIYLYARDAKAPAGFQADELRDMMGSRV